MRRLVFVTRAELFKLLKYPLTWGVLAAVLVLTLVGIRGDLLWAQKAPPETLTPLTVLPQEYRARVTLPGTLEQIPAAFELLNVFVLLLTIVVAGMDFEWGSIRPVLGRMPARGWLLVARFIALAAVAALFVLALWLTRLLAAWPAGRIVGDDLVFSFLDGPFLVGQAAMFLHTWLSTLPAIALGLLVATMLRNMPMAILLGGMGYFLAWMALMLGFGLLPFILGPAVRSGMDPTTVDLGVWGFLLSLAPHYNMAAVAHWGNPAGMARDPSLTVMGLVELALPYEPWRALGLLALYCLFFLILARRAFWKRDITS